MSVVQLFNSFMVKFLLACITEIVSFLFEKKSLQYKRFLLDFISQLHYFHFVFTFSYSLVYIP